MRRLFLLSLLCLLLCKPAASVALDSSAAVASASSTPTISVTTHGENRLVVLAIGWTGNSTAITTAPSATGITFTRITSVTCVGGRLEVWQAQAASVLTNATVTVTVPSLLLTQVGVVADTYWGCLPVTNFATQSVLAGNVFQASGTTPSGNNFAATYGFSIGTGSLLPIPGFSITAQVAGSTLLQLGGDFNNNVYSSSGSSVTGGFTNSTLVGCVATIFMPAVGPVPFAFC